MYPLGLLILWLQIHKTYSEELAVSWYAANLVPNTVLIGMGASAVWDLLTQPKYLFYLVILLVGWGFIAGFALRQRRRGSNGHSRTATPQISESDFRRYEEADFHIPLPPFDLYLLLTKRDAGVLAVLLSIFLLLMVAGWIYLILQGSWIVVASDVVVLGSLISGLLLMVRGSLETKADNASNSRRFLKGFAIAFLGILVSAVLNSGFQPPTLPHVQMGSDEDPKEGVLLARTEEYWFMFDSEGEFSAIPNDSAGEVRFLHRGE